MKISYRREMKHNYLIIDPEDLIWRNYECKMLSGNAVRGILRFQLRQVDDEVRFYYEITSRQPLSRMLESHLLRESQIRQIILGISHSLDRMEEYLLRENCVLLEPDYIYVEPENFEIWLCLVPGLERDFPYDYGKLLEYLLGKVDHQDRGSVILAYGLYQETRKANYGMEDILRVMCSEKPMLEEKAEMLPEERYEPPQEIPPVLKRETDSEPKAKSLKEAGLGWFSKWKKQWNIWKKEPKKEPEVSWEDLFREDSEEEKSKTNFVEPCDSNKEPILEEYESQGRNTTLLADLSKTDNSQVRKLLAEDPGMEDILIPYYPFVIGKQEHLADYYLDHGTVSRLHVRIDQNDDGWVIQDLNSSNGTMVAGHLLENNETAALHLNDEVKIADLCYRFM